MSTNRSAFQGDIQGTCDYESISNFDLTTFYSFKFIKSNEDPIKAIAIGTGTERRIEVTIPAGSKSTTFRLDPHRCPDSTSVISADEALTMNTSNSSTISVLIKTTSEGDIFDEDAKSKKLKVEFQNGALVGALVKGTLINGKTFDTAFTDAMASFDNKEERGKQSPFLGNTALAAADKVGGKYGTDN